MPTFQSKPLGTPGAIGSGKGSGHAGLSGAIARLTPRVRRHPVLLFGMPFVLTIVAGSYGLSTLTQTRFDYNASKVQSVSKEEELGMRKDRRRIDIREEYYRLQAKNSELDNWEPKRVPRPEGVPEWGVPPSAPDPTPPNDAPQSQTRRAAGPGPSLLRERHVSAEERPAGQEDSLGGLGPRAGRSAKGATVLGPDGKPCRACNSKLAFSAAMRGGKGGPSAKAGGRGGGKAVGAGAGATAAMAAAAANGAAGSDKSQCPPDGDLLGHSTWTFLHSAAAYYPPEPDTAQQSAMLSMIRALPHLYPCHSCAYSLSEELARESSEGASWEGGAVLEKAVCSGPGIRKWLCGLHNEVNARLGKPVWPCEEKTLQQRWLEGPDDGSCD